MKMKKVFTVLVMLFLFMTICVQAVDMSYWYDYTWKVIYKCYDDECTWIWKLCKTICINSDGFIYNKTNTIKIGKWTQNSGPSSDIEFYSDCGELYGTIFFLDFPSVAMEGQGYSQFNGSWKFVKIFLVRGDHR